MTHRASADRRSDVEPACTVPLRSARPRLPFRLSLIWLSIAVAGAAMNSPGPAMASESGSVAAIELADGTTASGSIERLGDATVDLVADGKPRSLVTRDVRGIDWNPPEAAPPRKWPVRIRFVDGSRLAGDDLTVSGKDATVVRDGRPIAIPREAIADADFTEADPDAASVPSWNAKLQEGGQDRAAGGDVVVVGSKEGPEFVECAIVAVAPDAVTVLLDDETVRVKRSKVIGLKWLRQQERDPPPGGEGPRPTASVVELDGGRLVAARVAIDGDAATIDLARGGQVRLPAGSLRRIDFAAGRTVSLVSLEPERVEVEPWFGFLASIDGLAAHFRPRPVVLPAAAGGRPREGLRVRPRTTMEWRMPEHARKLAMVLSESSSLVTVSLDGREAYRGQPSADTPVAADIAGARRLTVTVEFPPTGPGTGGPRPSPVVLVEPRIER